MTSTLRWPAFMLLLAPAWAQAGICFDRTIAGASLDLAVGYSHFDVIVATVESVSEHPPTFGNPPIVKLKVHEVLRGDAQLDRQWSYFGTIPFDEYCGGNVEVRLKQWAAHPLVNPKVGQKLIVLGQKQEFAEVFWFQLYWFRAFANRWDYSEANRALALKGIAEGERLERERQAKKEAEAKAHADALKAFRAKTGPEDIRHWATKANFIGIGTVSSGPGTGEEIDGYNFYIRPLLRGVRRIKYNDKATSLTSRSPRT